MKIVILGNQSRSVANFWTVLMRHLIQKGHEVLCLVPAGDAESDDLLQERCTRLCHYFLSRKGLNPLEDLRSLAELWRFFRNEKPDLLFTSTIKPVIYGSLAAKFAGVPHIYATITGLGYTFEADSVPKRIIRKISVFLQHLALKQAEGVFFQNKDDETVFRSFGIITETTRVLRARGTGVDTKHFSPVPFPSAEKGALTFLFIGRLLTSKGILEFRDAASILGKKYPKAVFQVLGPKENGLGGIDTEEIASWEKEGILQYLGATSDVRPYLARCHALVLPSYREGTPTVCMEAMSSARALIVSDAPGCREVIRPRENGLMVPVKDSTALAQAMEFMLNNPDQCRSMGEAGRRMAVDIFDADAVASHILNAMHC
ncbi:MAG: glycosyltransferase family 4 protein [Desulfovibrio sp.]|nr:glycosyltransferase family 4 protein [Desulfovibrio sp.]